MTIHALFEQLVATQPDATAVLQPGITLSYRDLDSWGNAIAEDIVRSLPVEGSVVAILAQRSAMTIAAMLGVSKSGNAYVCIDPTDPPERMQKVLQSAALLIHSPNTVRLAQSLGVSHKVVCDIPGETCSQSFTLTNIPDRASICYTSGSSGQPKGVIISHRSIVNLVRAFDFHKGDIILHASALSFDASTFEIWGAVCNGAAVAVYADARVNADRLKQFIFDYGVTVVWTTAGLFHAIADTDLSAMSRVRTWIAGGDVVQAAAVKLVLGKLPHVELFNGYGPTETTTFATIHRISGTVGDSVPIGSPLPNVCVRVVDEALAPVEPGASGELLIGGAGLSVGYLNDPDLTAARFITDPLDPTSIVYRTGDLVREENGLLNFEGRIDRQIKISGYRIEPGEVETALLDHADVRQALVVSVDDPDDRYLAGFVVTRTAGPGESDLRDWLRSLLPAYMLPRRIAIVPGYPLTKTGKVDTARLIAELRNQNNGDEPAQDGTTASRIDDLIFIWSTILGGVRVCENDHFFDLGGNSLGITKLRAQLKSDLGIVIPLDILIQLGSPARIDDYLSGYTPEFDNTSTSTDIIEKSFVCAWAQERMLDSVLATRPYMTIFQSFKTKGDFLPTERLIGAIKDVVDRNTILRTNFYWGSHNTYRQYIGPARIDTNDYILKSSDETLLNETISKIAYKGFNLQSDPVVRLDSIVIPTGERYTILSISHLCFDARSIPLFWDSVAKSLRGEPIPAPASQFYQYAEWQRCKYLEDRDPSYEKNRIFETSNLPPPVRLADTVFDVTIPYDVGRSIPFQIAGPEFVRLTNYCKTRRVSLFSYIATVVFSCLFRHSGQETLALGTVLSERDHPSAENMIGLFLNWTGLACTMRPHLSFEQNLESVNAEVIRVLQQPRMPHAILEREVRASRPDLPPSLYNIGLNVVPPTPPLTSLGGTPMEPHRIGHNMSRYDYMFYCFPTPDQLFGNVSFRMASSSIEVASRLTADFERLLAVAPTRAGLALSDGSLWEEALGTMR